MRKSITSLTELANHKQTTVYLIEQQLKSRRFFDDLERIGLGQYWFEPNLDHLILKNVELDDGSDETYALYAEIVSKYSRKIKPDLQVIKFQAKKMYRELISLKKYSH